MDIKTGTKKRKYLGSLAMLVVLVLLIRMNWLSDTRSGIYGFIGPVASKIAFAAQEAVNFGKSFVKIGSLSRAVRLLEEKNAGLETISARLQAVEDENKILREQLQLLPRAKYNLASAEVISTAKDGIKEALIINKGSSQGIKEGMPVIINEGIVIGRVAKTDSYTSAVILLNDSDFRLVATVQGTKAQGLLRGNKNVDISLEEVPRNQEIRIGDKVVTTGLDGLFPPDLLVGFVRTIDSPENQIFQNAKINSPANFNHLRIVSVITGKK